MPSAKQSDVKAAFDLLIQEVDLVVERATNEVTQAAQARDFRMVHQAADKAKSLKSFRDRLDGLRREWRTLCSGKRPRPKKPEGRPSGGLPRGARTPEKEYYVPILSALADLGGGGKVREVLERVKEKMKPLLKPIDYQSLPSNPGIVRWCNTAQWARDRLVRRGLMKADSRKGFWEISSEGRTWLAMETHNERGNDRGSGDGASENS
jgi:restriction system protein